MEPSLLEAAPRVAGRTGPRKTDRQDLIPIDDASVEALAAVFAKPEVWQFPYGRAFTRSETGEFAASQAEHWSALGFGLWMLVHRESTRPLGYAGLAVPTFLPQVLPAVEVGWRLDPQVWGQGYATEAANAALEDAFTILELEEVISLPQVDNPPSARVAERIGMKASKTIVAPPTAKRGAVQVAVMTITATQWAVRA